MIFTGFLCKIFVVAQHPYLDCANQSAFIAGVDHNLCHNAAFIRISMYTVPSPCGRVLGRG